jgi:hypothetical protein
MDNASTNSSVMSGFPLPNNQQQPQQKPKRFLYFFIGFITIATLAAFLIGGFVLGNKKSTSSSLSPTLASKKPSPTPDPTSSWISYDDRATNGFLIKYPEDWHTNPPQEGCGPVFRPQSTNKVWVTICGPDIGSTPDSLAEQAVTDQSSVTKKETFVLQGYRGIRQEIKTANNTGATYETHVYLGSIPVNTLRPGATRQLEQGTLGVYLYVQDEKLLVSSLETFNMMLRTLEIQAQRPAEIQVPSSQPNRPEMTRPATGEEMTVCTMEARLCPDGSSVGRTGPNCEFAACPGN